MGALIMLERVLPREAGASAVLGTLALPFERREKTRQRVRLHSGLEVGLNLPRGTVLRGGDRLCSAEGAVVVVVAAAEPVSTVVSDSPRELARAAYHLGNRHVAVELGERQLRYLQDHVLDAMVRGLGLAVRHEQAPFEPEAGAYSAGHTGHTHEHGHAHGHSHGPGRSRSHDHGHG